MLRRCPFAGQAIVDQLVERRKIRVLFEHHDIGAGNDRALAAIRFDTSCNQLHQRGLARAIAPDQRQPIARSNEQVDVAEQPSCALLQGKAFIGEDGRS